MTRRSSRQSAASASTTPKKRTLSSTAATPVRGSKRAKPTTTPAKTTPQKSPYFESDSEVPQTEIEDEGEGYEDEDASAVSTPSESDPDDEEEEYSEEEEAPRRRTAPKGKRAPANVSKANPKSKGQELWRPGVKAGLGPGKEIIIRLPKAREAGSTPYQPHTIHPNTFLFLGDLARNNDREWLKMHDADFRAAEKDFDAFVDVLTGKIIEKDSTIPELPVKDLKFRIYRDIRFSSDPTPYKAHFSAAWSRTGRKGPYAAYYLHVQPGKCYFGGGLWHPEAAPLALLRRSVDRRSERLKQVLQDASMRKEFLGGVSKDEKKVVQAFLGHNQENILKTKPKGFEADNPNINILRLRNYTVGKRLADVEVLGPKGLRRIADLVGILMPFITYLNSVVMPDDDPSSHGSSDEEGQDGESDEG
ncbi:MAG: hypothetical protein M1838_001676 [Thelocarpon superellum]|nr:MAG: hypothetical protein M1838_001676 [Thelocarpon superellum]